MESAKTARNLRTAPALATLALTALLLTGCGGSPGNEPTTKGPTSPESSPAQPSPSSGTAPPSSSSSPGTPAPEPAEGNFNVELQIKITPSPDAQVQEYLLECDRTTPSEASNVPQPEAACALVEESAQGLFFTKPDPTLQCTQQFGGPQTATVTGTVDGRPVQSDFARSDGCEIDRWQSMEPILGAGGVM